MWTIELVRTLAWPVLIAGVLFFFRDDVRGLIPRLRKVGPGGVEMDPAAAQSASKASLEPTPSSVGTVAVLPNAEGTLALFEQNIRRDLGALHLAQDEKEKVLVRAVANSQLAMAFERIYTFIFGSQIAFLHALNPVGALPRSEAARMYAIAASAFPDVYRNYSLDGWLGFLSRGGLVNAHADHVEKTPACQEFLSYVAWRQLPENKTG